MDNDVGNVLKSVIRMWALLLLLLFMTELKSGEIGF
jgi:hypothetical protein